MSVRIYPNRTKGFTCTGPGCNERAVALISAWGDPQETDDPWGGYATCGNEEHAAHVCRDCEMNL